MTVRSGELAIPRVATEAVARNPSQELVRRLEAFRRGPDKLTAADLIETAIVEGLPEEAVRAARILLLPRSGATPLLREQAGRLLREVHGESEHLGQTEDDPGSSVAPWRAATRSYPRDPLAWVELALGYVTVGKNEAALRAMAVALQLAPNDRHVLRSASRLFLHRRDAGQAHDLLRNNAATRTDPWLMAGEIALSSLAGRSPRFFKAGVALVDEGGTRPLHLSELASAIGTVHLKEGNRKARRLFNTSLIDPTGNSLAQAEWVNPRLGGLVDRDSLDRKADSIEARVFEAYWRGEFREMVKRCEAWRVEEPYSSRPAQFASGAAITIEDFDETLRFCDEGLKKNPEHTVLKNNRAYALVATERYTDAAPLIASCLANAEGDDRARLTATHGFLFMRTGDLDRGTKLYRDAISSLRRSNNLVSESLAWAYFAQEAARAGLPEAAQILEDARNACKRHPYLTEAPVLLGRAERWMQVVAHRNGQMSLVKAL